MVFSKLLASYHDINLDGLTIEDVAQKIGSQLGEVEWYKDTGATFDGTYLAKIVSCEKHPDADKLNVCMIDDGSAADGVERNEDGLVQVVCGAPNARAGIFVAWIAPGSIAPSTVGTDEEFELSARELRGVVSNGMIASERELGISDEHDGIMEIDIENEVIDELAKPGTPFKNLFGLDDWLIDVENKMFTHRPDCFGNLGITRELFGILGQKFESPDDWYTKPSPVEIEKSDMNLKLFNEVEDLVPRFAVGAMDEITIKSSPVWLKAYLSRIGSKPINIVVDWTNYIMMRTAQPTHAFDYDKVAALSSGDGAVLGPRLAKNGEKLKLLNGKEIELTDQDLVIATDKQPVALAGIMGGSETEVDENTKRILIEGATFDMYAIRRSSMRHGLFTDAGTRFTKGQSPHQNEVVIKRIMYDLRFECNSKAVDYQEASKKDLPTNQKVSVSSDFINSRLGSDLSAKQIEEMLTNVEFEVEEKEGELTVLAPFWRTDIAIPEDIAEEVGRLFGYDNLPLTLPQRSSKPTKKDGLLSTKQKIAEVLASAGANEMLTYSFVNGKLLKSARQDPENSYGITNALSPELEYYRQSVVPSLLDKVYMNIRNGYSEFAIFEIAKTHNKSHTPTDEGVPGEIETTGFVYVNKDDNSETAYFKAKKYLDHLFGSFNLKPTYKKFESDPGYSVTSSFGIERSAMVFVGDDLVGIVGEFRSEVESAFRLPRQSAGFELFTKALTQQSDSGYTAKPDFPTSTQDLTLKIAKNESVGSLERGVKHVLVDSGLWFEVNISSIFSKDDKYRNVTFRISVADRQKTMKTEEVNELIDKIVSYAKEHNSAVQA